ncbi:MAG TPA: molybdate ABC transporter substrate-binding protein [Candidimonas sp.]|nr:molybdate ABC transporter substrate-binding protein [Candidimonas sp.]
MKIRALLASSLCGMLVGFSASAADLLVSAASSLSSVGTALAVQYQNDHPGTNVLMSFAASDAVLQQIQNGAPADIFASADPAAMDRAVVSKAVEAATRRDFASNDVVMVVPIDNPAKISSLADLRRADVKRIALGNPAWVPAGRYSQAGLQSSGDWDNVHSKAVLSQNVRQALDYVARGEAQAGFVFATDAASMRDKVKVVGILPTPEPVRYSIALVNRQGRHPQAQPFLDFVISPQGQAILAKYGFKAL